MLEDSPERNAPAIIATTARRGGVSRAIGYYAFCVFAVECLTVVVIACQQLLQFTIDETYIGPFIRLIFFFFYYYVRDRE